MTDKRVAREVRLASVPRDALALSIALAAQELLRASWIEAAFVAPPEPQLISGMRPVPPEVRDVNREATQRWAAAPDKTAGPWVQVALLAAGEHAAGGQTALGGDLRVAAGMRLFVAGELGLRAAPDVSSAHGVVRARQVLGGLGIGYLLVPREAAWGGTVDVRADVVDVEFSGAASAGAQGASGTGLGALLGTHLGAWWRLGGPWRLAAEAGISVPLHAVTASDEGTTATGISGVTAGVALGVAAAWPE